MLSRHLGCWNWQRIGTSQKSNLKGPADGLKEERGGVGGKAPFPVPASPPYFFISFQDADRDRYTVLLAFSLPNALQGRFSNDW